MPQFHRRAAALTAALAATLAVAVPAAEAGAREVGLEQHAVPADIHVGPDGAAYAPDGSLGRLWRVTPRGKVSSIDLGGGPAGVATGSDGALWVTDRSPSRILRVGSGGTVTPYAVPTSGGFPTDIAAGPDGALWFTEARGDKIGRITTGGAITEYPLDAGASPTGIVAGPDGALWFSESGTHRLGRITTAGALTHHPLPAESLPATIVPTRHGLRVLLRNTEAVARVAADGTLLGVDPIPMPGVPDDIAIAGRRIYVGQGFPAAIGAMTLDGAFLGERRVRSSASSLAVDRDGDTLWYASDDEGRVGRIELDRGRYDD